MAMDFIAQGLALKAQNNVGPSHLHALGNQFANPTRNTALLIWTDSRGTGGGGGSGAVLGQGWSWKLIYALAALYPKMGFTIQYGYNKDTGGYGAPTVVSTGTSGFICYVQNVAISGTIPSTIPSGSNRMLAFAPATGSLFDAAICLFGVNYDLTLSYFSEYAAYMVAIQQLLQWQPDMGLVIIQGWPFQNSNNAFNDCRLNSNIASQLGATLIETEADFMNAGKPTSMYWTGGDTIHGSESWYTTLTNKLLAHFTNSKPAPSLRPPSILVPTPNLLLNGKFDTFSAGTAANWTGTNVTLTEDTSDFITGSRSLVMTIGTNVASYIEQQISGAIMVQLSRQAVTLSADIKLPSGFVNLQGQLEISYNGSPIPSQPCYVASSGTKDAYGAWYKRAVSYRLPEITSGATPLILRVYALKAANTPTGAGNTIKVDNIKLDPGLLPYGQM